MRSRLFACICALAVMLAVMGTAAGATLFGPTPYLSFNDSPFKSLSFSAFWLEDFEGWTYHTPGATYSGNGINVGYFGDMQDSVDGDDGVIDGFGAYMASMWAWGDPGVTITFDADALGGLPTHAGVVWTDGDNPVMFEAFDGSGNSLGAIGPVYIADDGYGGTTAEDRFFGVESLAGVGSIRITNGGGEGMEIDHVQYGRAGARPHVLMRNKTTRDPAVAYASPLYEFSLWGRVQADQFGLNGFTIDDGSGAPVRVSIPSHSTLVGHLVKVTGRLDTMVRDSPVLDCAVGAISILD